MSEDGLIAVQASQQHAVTGFGHTIAQMGEPEVVD